jgi:hypothetical protein
VSLRDLHREIAQRDAELWGDELSNYGVDVNEDDGPDDDYEDDRDDAEGSPPLEDEPPDVVVHAEPGPADDWTARDHAQPRQADAPVLGDDFWNTRPSLLRIRLAAHAQQCSAGFLLEAVLARVAAAVPCEIQLPAPIGAPRPLSLFVAGVAPSGVGKTVVNDNARLYFPISIPAVSDQLPLGSGEGLIEAFFDWVEETTPDGKTVTVKQQTRYGAYYYVDEGQVLAELSNRKGATILPTIRAMFSGAQIGNTNAARDTRRLINPGDYTVGLVVSVQPRLAGALLDDADAGTPQRFLWAHAADPTIPDEPTTWPPPIGWEPPSAKDLKALRTAGRFGGRRIPALKVARSILDEIRQTGLARARGAATLDPLDAHATLVRFKVSGLLALLERRVSVTPDDWSLADSVMQYSNAVRVGVLGELREADREREDATTARAARRHVGVVTAEEQHRVVECAKRIAKKVRDEPNRWTRGSLYKSMSYWRDVFDDALDHALGKQWVIEEDEQSRTGNPTRRLRPGPARAS